MELEQWWYKYRPQRVEDCILPAETKLIFENIVKTGKIDNMSFAGSAGIGKTTVARCISKELNCNELFINASQYNGIDMIRNKIVSFGSTVSVEGGQKLIILDEADTLTPQAQKALRHIIEQFTDTRFILTCNFPKNLLDPLLSRCPKVEFKTFNQDEKINLQIETIKRCISIMQQENVQYDQKDLPLLKELVEHNYPDLRRVINSLEKMCKGGTFKPMSILTIEDELYRELFKILKTRSFKGLRQWCAERGSMIESDKFFRDFYDLASEYIQPQSLPNVILLISQYAFRAGHVADQEINIMAFLIEASNSEYK